MPDVIVIGAGITGLSCAWKLQTLGVDTLVLESSKRVGGVIRTERVNGYLVEWGPSSLQSTAETFRLLDEAGLSSDLLESDPRAPIYVYANGSLRKIPFGPLSLGGLLRMFGEPFIRSKSTKDESVSAFFRRRVGNEAHDRLVVPFVTGIYAGDTQNLSMAATFPRFVALEREHGSLVIGMLRSSRKKTKGKRLDRGSSFANGLETLPHRLSQGLNLRLGVSDVRVGCDLDTAWSDGEAQPKAVVITVPAYRALSILERGMPSLARLLENVEYAPMVVAATSLPDSAFSQPLRGFGFLVSRAEKIHLLGARFSSNLFPGRAPQGRALLTSFVGGAFEPEAFNWPDDRVWDVVGSELQQILHTSANPEPVALVRHRHAIPQYRIGHERWVAALRAELKRSPGLFITGNYLEGVSVPSCMENGERTAHDVAEFIRSKP